MPDDPESIGELGRMLRDLRADMRERFDALDKRQDSMVPSRLYESEMQGLIRRMDDLVGALADERTNRKEAITALEAGIRRSKTEARAALYGAVIPVVALITMIVLQVSGSGA